MTDDNAPPAPFLSAVEARVLGSLMEKELTTPDNYPLTLNSLTLACNQKTSREPVMNLSQGEVGHIVNGLAERELVRVDYGDRAKRITHRMPRALGLNRKQQAILAVLLLRLPQTLNEVRSRTQRMAEFDGPEEILVLLDEMAERRRPLVRCLPKGPGQREDRYAQLLCGEVSAAPASAATPAPPSNAHPDRIDELEDRIAALEERLEALLARLEAAGDAPG